MGAIKALILGIVAGITDFLPVSATGHMTLFANILGVQDEIDLLFMIAVHIGTMIAVIVTFIKPIRKLCAAYASLFSDVLFNLKALFSKGEKRYKKLGSTQYRKLAVLQVISLIPTVIICFIAANLSETLTGNLLAAGIGMLISALLLLVSSFAGKNTKGPHETKLTDALLIGAFHGFSGFPGISRVAMGSSSAFLSGLTTKFAMLYTFLLGIPSVIGAFVVEIIRSKSFVSTAGALPTLVAVIAAAVVGFFVLKIARQLINHRIYKGFAIYCCLIGIASVIIYII